MEKKRSNLNYLIYIVISLGMVFIFKKAAGLSYNESGKIHGLNYNLVVYVGALAAAFLVFLLLSLAADLIGRGRSGDDTESTPLKVFSGIVLYPIYTAIAGGLLLLFYEIYINECNLYPGDAAPTYLRQRINHRYYFIVIFIAAAIFFFTLSRNKEEKKNPQFRFGLGFLFALLNAIATFCPNIFADTGGGIPHIHAVLNTIVNVARLEPYSQTNCSIYGHFGLIFMPIVKLFGGNLTAIVFAVSFFTFITFACAFYAASKLIRRDVIYFITLFAITGTTTIFTRRGQYFQINPLRLLFPMVILAVITFGAYHRSNASKIIRIFLELLVGTLAVIWNFETGLFSVCVCACVIILRSFYRAKPFSKSMWLAVLKAVLYGAFCLGAAYGIVNLYNILTGGTINSPRLFVYPLFSGTYNVNNLRVPLPSVEYLYFFQILLFFISALIVLRNVRDPENEAIDTIRFAIGLSGLSSLIYFINRAAYANMSIAHIQMILLLASHAQFAIDISKDNVLPLLKRPAAYLRSCISIILFGGLVWMAIEGALYIEVCYEYRSKSSWITEDMNRGIQEIKNELPNDCWAFGFCVPELWYQMGWENVIYMTDWSDMNDYNREYVREEIKKHDMVISTVDDFKISGYHVEKEVVIKPYNYRLWVRDGYTWDKESDTVIAVTDTKSEKSAENGAAEETRKTNTGKTADKTESKASDTAESKTGSADKSKNNT